MKIKFLERLNYYYGFKTAKYINKNNEYLMVFNIHM